MKREKYPTRAIHLRTTDQVRAALYAIQHAPVDAEHPIEVVLREPVKARKPDQNALMWSGPLKDIAEQAYVAGRTYSAEVWHELFKEKFLPEDFDGELCREGYRKWDFRPDGKRVLIGSTTELTVKGFAEYLEQVYAEGACMGVLFHANPNELRRAA